MLLHENKRIRHDYELYVQQNDQVSHQNAEWIDFYFYI